MQTSTKNIVLGITLILVGAGINHGFTFLRTNQMPSNMYHGNSPSMENMMTDMSASLNGKKGVDFDKTFIDQMIIHHEGAVIMAQQALTNAEHQEIKDLAKNIISAQNNEITQMNNWRNTWFR